jgi:4-hydroxybenzoate polyprenyltransferase
MKAFFQLIRWQNLLFLAIIMWVMEKWVGVAVMRSAGLPEIMPWWYLLLLTAAVLLVAAGGYVINDYFDVKIDRINRPDRLLVTTSVTKQEAMRLFQILTAAGVAAGLAAAWVARSWPIATVFLLVPGLLWFYSASYKRMFLVGNLIVSFCAALTPLLVALADAALLTRHYKEAMPYMQVGRELFLWLGGFALFAFLMTWMRETVKDLQDQSGDRELECHTLPVVIGTRWTQAVVTLLVVATAGLLCYFHFALLPFDSSWRSLATRYLVFGLLVPLACELALLWSAKIPSDFRTAQQLLKFVMFFGVLYGWVVFRLL